MRKRLERRMAPATSGFLGAHATRRISVNSLPPTKVGTHDHRCLSWSLLRHLITRTFGVMGPGAEAGTTSRVLMQIFKHSQTPLSSPGSTGRPSIPETPVIDRSRNAPLVGSGWQPFRSDLPLLKSRIFLQRG